VGGHGFWVFLRRVDGFQVILTPARFRLLSDFAGFM
jgi:hypothetical protein